MDRRDGTVKASEVLYVRLPSELLYLCKQNARRRKLSLTQGVRRLLESHPEVAYEAERLYDRLSTSTTGEDLPS